MHPRDTPDTRSVRLAIRLRNSRERAATLPRRRHRRYPPLGTHTASAAAAAAPVCARPPPVLSGGEQLRVNLSAHSKFGAIETPAATFRQERRIRDNALSPPSPLLRRPPVVKLSWCLAENLTARGLLRPPSADLIQETRARPRASSIFSSVSRAG